MLNVKKWGLASSNSRPNISNISATFLSFELYLWDIYWHFIWENII